MVSFSIRNSFQPKQMIELADKKCNFSTISRCYNPTRHMSDHVSDVERRQNESLQFFRPFEMTTRFLFVMNVTSICQSENTLNELTLVPGLSSGSTIHSCAEALWPWLVTIFVMDNDRDVRIVYANIIARNPIVATISRWGTMKTMKRKKWNWWGPPSFRIVKIFLHFSFYVVMNGLFQHLFTMLTRLKS